MAYRIPRVTPGTRIGSAGRALAPDEEKRMMEYHVVVGSQGGTGEETFAHRFDGEPQINLTFEHAGAVYRVVTRAHDEHAAMPTVHAERM